MIGGTVAHYPGSWDSGQRRDSERGTGFSKAWAVGGGRIRSSLFRSSLLRNRLIYF